MRIGAGEFNTVVEFLLGTSADNGAGGRTAVTWTVTLTARALVKYARAAEQTDAQRVVSLNDGELYIRQVAGLTTDMRARFDGNEHQLLGLVPVDGRYWRIPFQQVRE